MTVNEVGNLMVRDPIEKIRDSIDIEARLIMIRDSITLARELDDHGYDNPIWSLTLPKERQDHLLRHSFLYIGQLVRLDEEDLLGIRGFRENHVEEIVNGIAGHGYKLGSKRDYEPPIRVIDSEIRQFLYRTPMEYMNLPNRSDKVLKERDHIFYFGQLFSRSAVSLSRIPNFGQKSLQDVAEGLLRYGATFEMTWSKDFGNATPQWRESLR